MQELAWALRDILNSAGLSGWRVYSYKADFSALWSLDNPSGEKEAGGLDEKFDGWVRGDTGEKHVLIVWDGMPEADEQPINILDHLTPFDWALSLSRDLLDKHLHNLQKKQPATLPALRILILDLYSHHHYNAFACRMLESILPAMPWIQVFRLLPRRANSQSAVDKNGVEEFSKTIKTIEEASSEETVNAFLPLNKDPGAAFTAVKPFVDAWTGNLLQSGSHHDVNNLLGPLLLSEAFNDQAIQGRVLTSRLPRRALLQHARWLGLAPDKERVGGAAGGRWFDIASSANDLGENIVVTLLDDQANNGWVDILTGALDLKRMASGDEPIPASETGFSQVTVNDRVTLSASTSCEAILKKLEQLFPDAVRRCDYRFELGFAGNGGDQAKTAEILLWDLRLSWDQNEEIKYFQRALTLAHRLIQAYRGKPWPWVALDAELIGDGTAAKPGLLGTWLKEAKAGSHGQDWRKEKNYLECLTLLPRIIATMDLSLPIVIFSSSGQRQITESVKGFGNIITAFEKPRFSGYLSDDVVIETKAKLCTAFEQAMKLLTARRTIQQLKACQAQRPSYSNIPQAPYVEIFIDESGDAHGGCFTVGGLALVYGGGKRVAETLDSAMAKTSLDVPLPGGGKQRVQLSWYGTNAIPKRLAEGVDATAAWAQSTLFPALKDVYDKNNVIAYPFALRTEAKISSALDVLSNKHLDNLYLRLSKEVLDCVLYELIPWQLGKSTVDIHYKIFVATRVRLKENEELFTEKEKTGLLENYGLLVEPFEKGGKTTSECYRAIRPDSFISILADVVFGRPNVGRPNIEGVIGIPINVNKSGGKPDVVRNILRYAEDFAYEMTPLKGRAFNAYREKRFKYANKELTPRQSHFVADVITNLALASKAKKERYALKVLGDSMLDDFAESGFQQAIDASKCLEANDRAGALVRAAVALKQYSRLNPEVPEYKDSFIPKIFHKIVKRLGELRGGEFLIFSRALDDWVTSPVVAPRLMPKRFGSPAPRSHPSHHIAKKSVSKPPAPNRPVDAQIAHSIPPHECVVLSGFGEDVTEQNVTDRVSDYLIRVGMNYSKSLKAGRSDGGELQCELLGLIAKQCKQVKGLLEEPPAAGRPPWQNCTVHGLAR